ncbi:TRAP transporter large permease subunit [Roseospira marina]|uniref:TRAP transporter large permease protein n=1 Tax=Roseospira marina TaxID=140057 RepID=A0A5M6ICG8_9PROT|nr:TRAP transporter large permease subunit [Roseospira marina]KAA5605469.1 TRAP transporter large permease subunit [Roseospira marina]MBB4314529.1 tripartite ATP-independent transporter DctM subunit [Roseospira marina]MBB5088643.1 tripartite ATP-independent transporter DctM subunit [Roseospira marina]
MVMMLIWVFPLLLFLSVPVAHALIAAATLILAIDHRPMAVVAQRLYTPTQSFPMLAIPFFILAGSLMMSGRFGENLVNFAKLLVGRFKGGMGHVSIVGSVMFGGVSGSAVADASALGNALIPVQKREGFPAAFAAAINSSASTIAVLIPPSIPLIIYGLVSGTSIIALFIAGILPGVLLGVGMLTACWLSAKARGFPATHVEGGWRSFRSQAFQALPALFMPVFVVGTLRFGIATPTEVSVLAVAYALLVGTLVYRDLSLTAVLRAMMETGVMTGAVMLIIMASSVIQWMLTLEQAPQALATWMMGSLSEEWMIILAMNVIMLVVGTFLDLPAAILLLGPLFVGIATAIGLDHVQLGLMMVVNLAIGLYTPPVGTTLFISSTIARVSIGSVVKELAPFYLVALVVLGLISYVPAFTIH